MSYSNIPQKMRNMNKWILWRKEVIGGRETKVPYQINGGRASVTDPNTWTTFENAVSNIGWNSGIGFVLNDDDPFVIIDYDEECPQEIIDRFDTYTEKSQSGRGVHIIMEGSFSGRKRKDKVECYQNDRYMVMTGDVVLDRPIANRQKELDKWREEHGLDEDTNTITREVIVRDVGGLDDILELMKNSSNTQQVLDLYYNGYPVGADKSREDSVLLEALRFYSGGDKEKAFALFEQSACCRDKWMNRQDYRERTWSQFAGNPVYQPQEFSVERMVVGMDFCDKMKEEEQKLWVDRGMPTLSPEQYKPQNMGVLTDICNLYSDTSPKPLDSFAMHTALATIGTYLARRFKTVSGNYTSLYWGVIAPTGSGKAHTTRIIDHVLTSLDPALGTLIRGSGYTSDSAVFSELQRNPAHIGIIDELGDYIAGSRGRNNHTANSQWRTLKEAWCNGGTIRPKGYSDHTVRTESNAQRFCICPNIGLFGNSTVQQFWSALSIKDGADGFLNRWLIYTDDTRLVSRLRIVDLNDIKLSDSMHRWHETICKRSPIRMMVGGEGDQESVPMVSGHAQTKPDPVILEWESGAEELFYRYQVEIVEPCFDDTFKYEMLQRSAQMARSIALIVELSVNPWAEFVTRSSCVWAIEYVNTVISQMAKYAKRHIAGNEEESLALKLLDAIRKAGAKGLTRKEMQALKLEEFTARNFNDAMARLIEGELIAKKSRASSGRGRNATAYYAIESEEKESE